MHILDTPALQPLLLFSMLAMTVVVDAGFMSLQWPNSTIHHSVVTNRTIASWLLPDTVMEAVFALILVETSDVTNGIQQTKDAKLWLLRALLSQTYTTTHQYYVKDQWAITKNVQEYHCVFKKASMAPFCHGCLGMAFTKSKFSVQLIVGFWWFLHCCVRHW